MKHLFAISFFFVMCSSVYGQTVNANSVIFADPTLGVNSDNTVIYRSDISPDYTRLRMQLGDEESALFEMGYPYYSTGQWTNLFTVDGYGNGYFRGNFGLGTTTPSIWFGGNTKVLEVASGRPVLKLNSTESNSLSSMIFTNSAVNGSSHNGEFHLNYQYDAATATNSALRFSSYPGGESLTLLANGNIGMGLVAPAYKLDISGTLRTSDHILGNQYISVIKSGSYRVSLNGQSHGYITGRDDSSIEKFLINSNGSSYFNGGNVGIGTMSPDQKLTVKGKIHTEEVIVDLSVPAPDYVFEKSYDLKSLDEVKKYIDENKHLPEVPSAKEMEKDGVKVGEMEMILLKKIEELTLYIITMKEDHEQTKKDLQAEIKELKSTLEKR